MNGRPRKSAAQHKAEGTYRKDRHGSEEALALVPVTAIDPPCWLPHTLDPTWRAVVGDLCAMGAVCPSDLVLLEQAFRLLKDTLRYQAQLDRLNDSVEANRQMAEDLMESFGHQPPPDVALQIAALATGCASEIKGLVSSMIACEAAYERILGKFGIGPADRARLAQMLPKRKMEGPGLDDLLK